MDLAIRKEQRFSQIQDIFLNLFVVSEDTIEGDKPFKIFLMAGLHQKILEN